MEGEKVSIHIPKSDRNGKLKVLDPALSAFLVQLPNQLQNCLEVSHGSYVEVNSSDGNGKAMLMNGFLYIRFSRAGSCFLLQSQIKRLSKDNDERKSVNSSLGKKGLSAGLGIELEKQLQDWRENPTWLNQPPEIKVSVPKGSLCNLKAKVNVGLPPDAVYNIVTDPDNKRVFQNIKEVISRKVLVDEGQRQVVEVEQAALWRFLWWSGTISVHVLVDQNREDHSMKFKQVNTGFMEKFEGHWRVEPVFVDEETCFPFKPKTWAEYCSCTGGKGRIGSKVSLDQLIQPAIVPPPPISWYLRGITSKTTEMLIHDLLAEAARLKGAFEAENSNNELRFSKENNEHQVQQIYDIKQRWSLHRRNAKPRRKRMLTFA